jgi:hypothetical protein
VSSGVLIVLACAVLVTARISNANDAAFPRLGGVNNGGPQNYDDVAYQADLAKLGVVLLGIWPGWDGGKKMPFEQIVRNIKKINPDTRVFLYVNSMEVDANSASYAPFYDKVDAMRWWLTTPGSTSKILSEYGTQTKKAIYQINTTLFTPRDSNGMQAWEWHARWIAQQLYTPNPSIDGFFEDNVFYQPRVSGDWNLDGVTDSPADAGQWLREGYRARFALLRKLMPGKYVIGNIADWGTAKADLTELKGTLDGGVIEGIIGPNYAPETWGGWAEMMRWYRKTMDAIAEPKLAMFHMVSSRTDYQGFRYGFASCLMDDGYFAFTDKDLGYTGLIWFDEYDAKLGLAIDSPVTKPWQSGVYRREFEGGIALVNPKGNGAQDVTVESGFRRLAGQQAPSINDGTDAAKIHLQDRDGIILLRKPRPMPPRLNP